MYILQKAIYPVWIEKISGKLSMVKKQKSDVEVFNIGTGRGLSVLELIHAFESATGVKLNYEITGRRAGDIEQVWALARSTT